MVIALPQLKHFDISCKLHMGKRSLTFLLVGLFVYPIALLGFQPRIAAVVALSLAFGLYCLLPKKWGPERIRNLNGWLLFVVASYSTSAFQLPNHSPVWWYTFGTLRALLYLVSLPILWPLIRSGTQRLFQTDAPPPLPKLSEIPWVKLGMISSVLYMGFFVLMTYPMIHTFSSHVWTDRSDGFQMLWNVWWFKYALLKLHTNPWFTSYLHQPSGISLLGASYHPYKSLLVVPFDGWLSLLQSYNVLVIISFVVSGVTMTWLAYAYSRSLVGSLVAGFIFGFCNNRFTHAQGHMHVISTEWMPLFLLFWTYFLERRTLGLGILCGFLLGLNLGSDHYAFQYCAMCGFLLFVWWTFSGTKVQWLQRANRNAFFSFLASAALFCGPILIPTFWLSHTEQWKGHDPHEANMDLLSPFIPGCHWKWARLTEGFWKAVNANGHEASVQLGVAALFLVALFWAARKNWYSAQRIRVWFFVMAVFWILALGYYPSFWGIDLALGLPYGFLYKYIPGFKLSGVPVRMAMMLSLGLGILCACAVAQFSKNGLRAQLGMAALAVILYIEFLPYPIPQNTLVPPAYVTFLKNIPNQDPVADFYASMTDQLFYQTVHEKPTAFGYVARVGMAQLAQETSIRKLAESEDFAGVCKHFGIRYLVRGKDFGRDFPWSRWSVFNDGETQILDLKKEGDCPSIEPLPFLARASSHFSR